MKIPPTGDAVPRRFNWITHWVGRLYLQLQGWRIEGELPNLPKFVLTVAPHTSNWDFLYGMAYVYATALRMSVVGKHTLFWWPLGVYLRWAGVIPLDRTARRNFVAQMVDEFSRREKMVLAITPEGTRKKVKTWRTGFYYIALGAEVPIVMLFIDYGRKVVGIGPVVTPTGDIEADMEIIQGFYQTITGKFPH